MRALLVVNHHARHGREPLDPVLGVFSRAGWQVTAEAVPKSREAADLIRRRSGEFDAVLLAGGDGTVHSAVDAVLETGLPIGILPRGTANDLARALCLPLDPVQAAEIIVDGASRRIDLGEVNGKLFFNVAHIGLGSALAAGLTKQMKQLFGPFAYTFAAARSLTKLKPFRAEIIADGERTVLHTFGITVGNGRFFGGRGIVAEDAEIDDGLLHLFSIATKNPLRLALIAPDILRGRHGRSKWVSTLAAPSLELRTTRPMSIRADGKRVTETPARFRVRPQALSVFAPAAEEAPRAAA